MNVKEIVEKYLKEHGYHGLCLTEVECGCGLDDFMPCDQMDVECEPAKKVFCKDCKDEDCEIRKDFCFSNIGIGNDLRG